MPNDSLAKTTVYHNHDRAVSDEVVALVVYQLLFSFLFFFSTLHRRHGRGSIASYR